MRVKRDGVCDREHPVFNAIADLRVLLIHFHEQFLSIISNFRSIRMYVFFLVHINGALYLDNGSSLKTPPLFSCSSIFFPHELDGSP